MTSLPDPHLLDRVITQATRAPSSHNTQPWRFRRSKQGIDLLADRSRALPVNDPEDRELTISCGAALFALRVAAAAEGLQGGITRFPLAEKPDCLARISLKASPIDEALAPLAAVLEQRQTERGPFLQQPPGSLTSLSAAAEQEDAWLLPLDEEAERQALADLVAEGDRRQWADPAWRRELAGWMRPASKGDGLTVPALLAPVIRTAVRHLDLGKRLAAKDRALALEAPVLALLGTPGDRPADWLRAGEALQRLLLTACRAGIQAGYLNQPLQVAALRPDLQARFKTPGAVQMILRLGRPKQQRAASPRRPLVDVTRA